MTVRLFELSFHHRRAQNGPQRLRDLSVHNFTYFFCLAKSHLNWNGLAPVDLTLTLVSLELLMLMIYAL